MNSERLLKLHFHKKEAVTWLGVEHFFSYESRLASMENRNPGRLMLSSEADLWNFSWSAFSSSSLCFLFFLLFLRSLALLELSLDPPEELSSDKPPLPLYSPLSVAAAAATCQPITAQAPLSGATRGRLSSSLHTESRQETDQLWAMKEGRSLYVIRLNYSNYRYWFTLLTFTTFSYNVFLSNFWNHM